MSEQGIRLVCFELCGEKFAFNMEYLIEIVEIQAHDVIPCVTPVPLVRGTWKYRKHSIYVIDIREFFGLTEDEQQAEHTSPEHLEETVTADKHERKEGQQEEAENQKRESLKSMLAIRIREQVFGLLTDTVLEVIPLGGFYEFPDLITTLPKRYLAGIIIVDAELVILLALENFINEYEFDSLASMKNSQEIENN